MGDVIKVLGPSIGWANLKWFANKTIKETTTKITLTTMVKIPPREPILAMAFIPLELKKVINRIIKIPKIPIVCVEERPKIDQVFVVSFPKKRAEKVIQTREAVETIQTIQDANQTKVPIKAIRSPIEPANQE